MEPLYVASLFAAVLVAGVLATKTHLRRQRASDRIEDAGAASFARRYYDALEAGDAVFALAEAQRASLRSEEHVAPFYWPGYRVNDGGA